MRIVVQRVSSAEVIVDGDVVGSIGLGLALFVAVATGDTLEEADAAVDKITGLRVFGDEDGRLNLSVGDVGGSVLVVSQFTLYGDVARGRRPSFTRSAGPEVAQPLIERVVGGFERAGLSVASGVFGARMEVRLVNSGPVTLVVELRGGKVVELARP